MKLFIIFVVSFSGYYGHGDLFDRSHEKWLSDNYLLKWKVNYSKQVVNFRVEALTKGWIEFGLSKHGQNKEIDIAIGWVTNEGMSSLNVRQS